MKKNGNIVIQNNIIKENINMLKDRYIHTYIYTYICTHIHTYIYICTHSTIFKSREQNKFMILGRKEWEDHFSTLRCIKTSNFVNIY